MIQWHLEVLAIKDLKEHPKNPRQISKEQYAHLENLITKFGLIDKPIINKDWTIIGGHQRIRILKKMKAKTVECWVPDEILNEKDVEELMVRHNLNQGSWDWDLLSSNFNELDLFNYGFTEQQILGCFEMPEEEEKTQKKKAKICPNCGHEV